MANYGSVAGIQTYMLTAGYADVIPSKISTTQVELIRTHVDTKINNALSAVVPQASLPLVVHTAVDPIADMFAACRIYKILTRGVSPNENENDNWFCTEAQDMLDALVANPSALGETIAANDVLISTDDQGREFVMGTHDEDGNTTDTDGDPNMGDDNW